jgi:hypothetical protein
MKRFLEPTERPNDVRDLPKHSDEVKNYQAGEHVCNFRWAKIIIILGWPTQSYCYRTLSGPHCEMKVKISKLENMVLLHACNFRWVKNITLSHETAFFSQIWRC